MTKHELELVELGCYIRVKLDKRGFHGALDEECMKEVLSQEKSRIANEVIAPMKQFIKLFENLS